MWVWRKAVNKALVRVETWGTWPVFLCAWAEVRDRGRRACRGMKGKGRRGVLQLLERRHSPRVRHLCRCVRASCSVMTDERLGVAQYCGCLNAGMSTG